MAQGFDINKFKTQINDKGLMRKNKFLVRVHAPTGLLGIPLLTNTARVLEYWCSSVNIPGISIATTESRRYGYGNFEKKPYVSLTNDANLEFISDSEGTILTFFQQWARMIVNFDMRDGINPNSPNGIIKGQRPFELAYKTEYISDVQILVFDDKSDSPQMVYVLREAYPIFVGDVGLNWADNNSIATVPVTLSMYDWYDATQQYNNPDTNRPVDNSSNFDPRKFATENQKSVVQILSPNPFGPR